MFEQKKNALRLQDVCITKGRDRKERSDGIATCLRHTQPCVFEQKKNALHLQDVLAGETRFEHATYGFGDRYSTVEPLP